KLPKRTRDFILYTDKQPRVPVYAGFTLAEVKRALKRKEEPSYQGTFSSARRHVLHSFTTSESAMMKRRAAAFLTAKDCPECHGKRLGREALSVKFLGRDISELSRLPLKRLHELVAPLARSSDPLRSSRAPEKKLVVTRIAQDLERRLGVLLDLGLGYLDVERSTPTLSPGELQRLRLATQVCSSLFGVVYVLDEPSAGLHPADTEALLRAFTRLRESGNSLFVVEHDLDVIRRADWIVDVGPGAGQHGGEVLYSGPLDGLERIGASETRKFVFSAPVALKGAPRRARGSLRLAHVTRNNLRDLSVEFPLGTLTCVTGVSGSGKSTLVSQVLVGLLRDRLGQEQPVEETELGELERREAPGLGGVLGLGEASGLDEALGFGEATLDGVENVKRLVVVDQKPIGRTPRSNLATYTGFFDEVRRLFAATPLARKRRYDAGRFSFNVTRGRCETCKGEGFVMIELLFLPSVYSPCPTCKGSRYNDATLQVRYRTLNIAEVLRLTVDEAHDFFAGEPGVLRALSTLRELGLGYLRLGQPATELSGGEAQRIKLATELQRPQRDGIVYVLDEPTTGLHPSDVDRLMRQLQRLIDAGATVIVVEHDLQVIAQCDHIIDLGPGAGDEGGRIVVTGTPEVAARSRQGKTAAYLRERSRA
ncbi:MAG TPA: excinuclease ABC subunit UvrA, partial [Polyangiaceae bacterium]|nr:excinuclease ABC subunit UvrA [Polyangiaceae bacterium]